jgi:hypothetical protein
LLSPYIKFRYLLIGSDDPFTIFSSDLADCSLYPFSFKSLKIIISTFRRLILIKISLICFDLIQSVTVVIRLMEIKKILFFSSTVND